MKLYSIQVGYKGTNGRLAFLEQEFEGENPGTALEMAKAFYSDKIRYRQIEEMIFSTPIESSSLGSIGGVVASGAGSIAIGGSISGTGILPRSGNVVQRGNHNINIGSAIGISIGDQYSQ
jgi:hypothetical protein